MKSSLKYFSICTAHTGSYLYTKLDFILGFKPKKTSRFCENSGNVIYYNIIFNIIASSPKFLYIKKIKVETTSMQNVRFVAYVSNELEEGENLTFLCPK